ncbi:MAG: hypothetical protein IKT39_03395 [Clostridia bacterium]|nr:hypothetical protein [Clostridia bacterium]
MIKIYSGGEKISCSTEDTFLLTVDSENGFEAGTSLKFQVAKDEDGELLIDKIFSPDGATFQIELTEEEKPALGEYVYRIVLMSADKSVITQKSGQLEVKWGA